MSINRVEVTGNITDDPELKATRSGSQLLTFQLAVNDRWRDPATGAWADRPNYVKCVVFGKRAPGLSAHLRRGMKVAVEGKLRWRQWTDARTGERREALDVAVDDVDFVPPQRQWEPDGRGPVPNEDWAPPNQREGDGSAAVPAPEPDPQPQQAQDVPPRPRWTPPPMPAQGAAPAPPVPEAPAPIVPPIAFDVADDDIPF